MDEFTVTTPGLVYLKANKSFSGGHGGMWYRLKYTDGTLSAYDGRRLLVALPAENARVPRGAESALRYIAGREYIVFPR